MNKIDWTLTGGMEITIEDFDYIFNQPGGLYDALNAYFSAFADNFIVQGCEVSGGNVTEGFVIINKILYKVDAHAKTGDYFAIETTYPSQGVEKFSNNTTKNTWIKQRAKASATSGTLKYDALRLDDLLGIKSAKSSTAGISTFTFAGQEQSWVVEEFALPSNWTTNNYVIEVKISGNRTNSTSGFDSMIYVEVNGGSNILYKDIFNNRGVGILSDINNSRQYGSMFFSTQLKAGDIIRIGVLTTIDTTGATAYYHGYTIS